MYFRLYCIYIGFGFGFGFVFDLELYSLWIYIAFILHLYFYLHLYLCFVHWIYVFECIIYWIDDQFMVYGIHVALYFILSLIYGEILSVLLLIYGAKYGYIIIGIWRNTWSYYQWLICAACQCFKRVFLFCIIVICTWYLLNYTFVSFYTITLID